jgi:hypothetical protein
LCQCGRTVDKFAKVRYIHRADLGCLDSPSTGTPCFHAGEGQDSDGLPASNDKHVCGWIAIASKVNLTLEDDMELGCGIAFPREHLARFEAANFHLVGYPVDRFQTLIGEEWQLQKLFGGYPFGNRLWHWTPYRLRMYWRMK